MGEPLSDEEIVKLRRLIDKVEEVLTMNEADRRARWFWAGMRSVALWITAVLGAFALIKTYLVDLLGKH